MILSSSGSIERQVHAVSAIAVAASAVRHLIRVMGHGTHDKPQQHLQAMGCEMFQMVKSSAMFVECGSNVSNPGHFLNTIVQQMDDLDRNALWQMALTWTSNQGLDSRRHIGHSAAQLVILMRILSPAFIEVQASLFVCVRAPVALSPFGPASIVDPTPSDGLRPACIIPFSWGLIRPQGRNTWRFCPPIELFFKVMQP